MKITSMLFAVVFIFIINSIVAQQKNHFVPGKRADIIILQSQYASAFPCGQSSVVFIQDIRLQSYMTGVGLFFMVNKIQPEVSQIFFNGKEANEGDLFPFEQNSELKLSQGVVITYSIIASGIPLIENELYPCTLDLLTSEENSCDDSLFFSAPGPLCKVNTISSIERGAMPFTPSAAGVKIYPNPTDGELTIEYEESTQDERIEIVDMLGI